MAKVAQEIAIKAFENGNREKEVANTIQIEFNKAYGYLDLFDIV